jgi:MFS family permease
MAGSTFYGWKLLAVFWVVLVINLAFPAYGIPIVHAYMVQDFALDRTLAGLPYSVYTVMSGLPGPLVALCVHRYGVRATVTLGSVLLILGSLLMAFVVQGVWGAAAVSGCIVGIGVAMGGPLGAQPSVVQWFIRKRALALSLVYSAGGIGGFFAAPLLDRIIQSAGGNWRAGWMLVAGLTMLSAIVAAVWIRDKPADLGQLPDGGTATDATGSSQRAPPKFITSESWTWREAAASRTFWLMVLALCGGSCGLTLFLAQGILHLKDLGYGATAAWSVSLMTASTLLGKLALAAAGDRIDPRYVWAFTLAVFGLGLVLLVSPPNTFVLYLCAVCIGFGFGGGVVCMMTVLSNYYGVRAFAVVAGIATACNTLLASGSPVIGGFMYDEFGSYSPVFYTLAAWCFAGAAVLAMLRPPVRGGTVTLQSKGFPLHGS